MINYQNIPRLKFAMTSQSVKQRQQKFSSRQLLLTTI
jgi:hypothetical protein